MSETITQAELLSPAPILEAVENYRGTIIDLDTAQVLSPDEFARAREGLTAALRRRGLMSGDRVVIALENGPLFIATLSAVLASEGSPLLLHSKSPPAELQRYAQRFGARFLACEPGERANVAEITTSGLNLDFAVDTMLHWATFEATEPASQSPVLRGVPLHPTSGSTGPPKVALRPGFAAIEEARHYMVTMGIDSDDTILALPPMSHSYGYGMCVMTPLLTGANILRTGRSTIKLIQRVLKENCPTILPTVPVMLDMLSVGGGTDLRHVRWVLTAGAMLPGRAAERFHTKTGATACPLYGTTETGVISVATAGDGRDVDGRVGAPMEGVSVEVRRPQESGDLGANTGKLFVRSSSMMVGYLDELGRISRPFEDGWFETGDLARIDESGSIDLRGRDSDVINVFGLKVVPCEVEEAITQLPGVVEVKVYAGEHGWGTQIVKAAVAVQGDITEADLRAHCEHHLVYYKRPQMITLVPALPRGPTGKINRSQLP